MIEVKGKQAERLLERAQANEGFYLWDVYGSYSQAKADAWRNCVRMYKEDENSENFRICSHNQWTFSVAWETIEDEKPFTILITKSGDYKIPRNR